MIDAGCVLGAQTRDAIMQRVRAGGEAKAGVELDMLSWSGRTTLEILGQAGLGHSFDPLTEDISDEYADAVKTFACVFSKRQLSSRVSAHLS